MSIKLENISKNYDDVNIIDNINVEISTGKLVALLGPSGSGKTTLLRIIAGLEVVDTGKVYIDNEDIARKTSHHNIGFVFQHYALFKHLTVFENVAFGLRARKNPNNNEIKAKVGELLKLVHIDKLHSHYPHELSGGQRQRVALARALAVQPKILLLDEPFGALDSKVRKDLRRWLRKLHDEINITTLFVTHDQEEALEVADQVIIMSNGKIEQIGSSNEVYHHPANSFVYDFLGNFNSFDGTIDNHNNVSIVSDNEEKSGGLLKLVQRFLPAFKREEEQDFKSNDTVKIFARPHQMEISAQQPKFDAVKAIIEHINSAGPFVRLELKRISNNQIIQVELSHSDFIEMNIQKKDEVWVWPKEVTVF